MTQKIKVGMVSLGCDKNRVDAELMLGILPEREFDIVLDEHIADVIIINTCGFIESAKEESIDTILEMAKCKESGNCKVLIASGCLAERYGSELLSEIPELDGVIGVGNYMEIESIIKRVLNGEKSVKEINNKDYDIDFKGRRVLTTPLYSAYVKIAEGCNNNCSYCIIPRIRGKYRSRSMENIVEEVNELGKNGTKEIILVAQDTTKYGIDLYGKRMLPELLRKISDAPGIKWIRLLYCYPEDITDELIEEIKNNPKICKYIDIPIQHVNNDILRRMRRIGRREDIEKLIVKLRESIPDIIIRTSLIVGFPGETEEQFNELYDFLKEYKLDRAGVFTYSLEEDTEAALFEDQISDKVKRLRQRKIIGLQNSISHDKNKYKIGKVLDVIIEGIKDDIFIGRTYGDSPEIDGLVYVKDKNNGLDIGEFVKVKITDGYDYDLVGEVYYESCE